MRLLASVIILGTSLAVLWLLGAFSSASNNITCKQQQGAQYVLCVAGQGRVYVPYSAWRSARVGGYYDKGSRRIFRTVDDDPAAPHGIVHGIVHGITDEGGGHGIGHGIGHGGGGGR